MNQTRVRASLLTLPRETRTYWTLHSALMAVVLTGIAVGVVLLFSLPVSVPLVVLVAGIVLTADLILIPLRHAWYRYAVTDEEFHVVRGRFFLRSVTVAVPQILHTEISQGPLLRFF